jgi:hypothetical protein
VHVLKEIGWKDGATTAEIEALRTGLKKTTTIFESIAPESGAYLNEVRSPFTAPCDFRLISGFLGSPLSMELAEGFLRVPL